MIVSDLILELEDRLQVLRDALADGAITPDMEADWDGGCYECGGGTGEFTIVELNDPTERHVFEYRGNTLTETHQRWRSAPPSAPKVPQPNPAIGDDALMNLVHHIDPDAATRTACGLPARDGQVILSGRPLAATVIRSAVTCDPCRYQLGMESAPPDLVQNPHKDLSPDGINLVIPTPE